MKLTSFFLGFILLISTLTGQVRFESRTIVADLQFGYQLISIDLNGDGKKDLIAVDERVSELCWFENPSWERHIMIQDVPRPINVDCWDYDGDGTPDCVLAYHFESSPEKSIGNVVLLQAKKNVGDLWTAREIDRVPTAHRIRWIDSAGDGKKVLLLAPLVGGKARAPLYEDNIPIYRYTPGIWKRDMVVNDRHGLLHAIQPVQWHGKGQSLLTASFEGLHFYSTLSLGPRPGILLHSGDPRPCPECGSSEVRLGQLGKQRFLAAIEPWHGNQLVLYRQRGKEWNRTILENGMTNGHALEVGDLDADGKDEILAGSRGKGFKLFLFSAKDNQGDSWDRTILDDGGIAAADCKIDDYSGDKKPDIACIGASTANLKLYTNVGNLLSHSGKPQ